MIRIILIFLCSLLFSGAIHAQEKNQITYIANQGIFIEYNGKKVLIDALHDEHFSYYQATRVPYRLIMNSGSAPFEKVDLFLVTSALGDHFDKDLTIKFFEKHKETIFVAPKQVLDTMGTITHLAAQFYPLEENYNGIVYNMDGINIQTFPLEHAYDEKSEGVENMAYLLDFEGLKVLHVGDANILPENLNTLQKAIGKGVDYAILPDWFFDKKDNIAMVKKQIKAKKFIAAHVLKMKTGNYASQLKALAKSIDMDLTVFLSIGQFEMIEK